MNARIFIDTNVLIYAFLDNEPEKHEQAVDLLSEVIGKDVFVSTQVLSEIYVALTRNGIEHADIEHYLLELEDNMNVPGITFAIIQRCLALKVRYHYSYWDSLILASALDNHCQIIYSEDMQDGQQIEQALTIRNPFKPIPQKI